MEAIAASFHAFADYVDPRREQRRGSLGGDSRVLWTATRSPRVLWTTHRLWTATTARALDIHQVSVLWTSKHFPPPGLLDIHGDP
jgi:hypothetical protein